MSDNIRWDQDPSRDDALGRVLREGGAAVPYDAVPWARLQVEVMRQAVGRAAAPGWWEFVAGWGRIAAAASVAAMLFSAVVYWRAVPASAVPDAVAAAPESVAIARVATAYPDETAFASLVRAEHHDEFTAWGTR